jgi:3-dehydroquinate synthase
VRARTIRVETAPAYDVRVGPGLLADVDAATSSYSARAIVTDENVAPLYLGKLRASAWAAHVTVPPGEDSKSLVVVEHVLDFLVESGLDRRSCVVALGGGVVGDVAGLAASLYMRGIACVHVPTTLLAQVDSSVGGKTAVNLGRGKNLAGTFHQPALVLADTTTLATLPDDELRSGLGEVVKTALLDGEEALAELEARAEALVARDADALADVVARCVRLKASIVARDPREANERKALNLGHTFAHGIEHAAGYGAVPHGVAVAVGLVLALRAGIELGVTRDAALVERVEALHARLGLPRSLAELSQRHAVRLDDPRDLIVGMLHDKKGAAGAPRFVLLEAPGRWRIDVAAPAGALERWLA